MQKRSSIGGAERLWGPILGIGIVLCVLVTFLEVRHFEFLNYDDPDYVVGNGRVRAGLTYENALWSLTAIRGGNWHPVTWASHMLDVEVYGLNPGGHHLTNLIIHALNSLLLFLLLRAMTGRMWVSAFTALMFGVHPMHVQSVAWISERKDVLSTCFWLLTLLAYHRYTKDGTLRSYALSLAAFVLALATKPMVVTLPFVLLLIDFWPLRRINLERPLRENRAYLVEKLPFFALSLVLCAVTLFAQWKGGAVRSFEAVPLGLRLENVPIAYVFYIQKLLWPTSLAVLYPLRSSPIWAVGLSLALLGGITFLGFRLLRRSPWLAVGWLWYLGILVPVIGIVHVGEHAYADRYTYVPYIGLFLIVAWGSAELVPRRASARVALALAALLVIAGSMAAARHEARYWKDDERLFRRALAVTEANSLAHNNLGTALLRQGRLEEAAEHFSASLRIRPDYDLADVNLGIVKGTKGDIAAAMKIFEEVLERDPANVLAHTNLGVAYITQGDLDAATRHLRQALRVEPYNLQARNNLLYVNRLLTEQISSKPCTDPLDPDCSAREPEWFLPSSP
jgi:tetratricopeptide (TPR) repeat protein